MGKGKHHTDTMLSFLVGTACVVAPQFGVPAAAALTVVKAARNGVKRGRRAAGEAAPKGVKGDEDKLEKNFETFEGPSQSVVLQFDDLKCSITTKSGKTKQILKGISGTARPGR